VRDHVVGERDAIAVAAPQGHLERVEDQLVRRLVSAWQPTIRRLKASMTKAT
jgi:hypothetical protein